MEHPEVVRILLANKNTQMDVMDECKKTALIIGCMQNLVECVEEIVHHEKCTDAYMNQEDEDNTCS